MAHLTPSVFVLVLASASVAEIFSPASVIQSHPPAGGFFIGPAGATKPPASEHGSPRSPRGHPPHEHSRRVAPLVAAPLHQQPNPVLSDCSLIDKELREQGHQEGSYVMVAITGDQWQAVGYAFLPLTTWLNETFSACYISSCISGECSAKPWATGKAGEMLSNCHEKIYRAR